MTSRTVRAVLLALVVVQIAWYWPRLPATVASHFDGSGRPNGWLSKEMFLAAYAGVVALLAVVFSAVRFIPTSLWNLPNRDYWLAPERRAATVARFSEEMLWFANATLALVLLTFELAFRANLPGGTFASRPMWVLLAAYFVLAGGWSWRFLRGWSKPGA